MPMDFEKLLVEESPDAAGVLDGHGRIVHWNAGAEAMFGYAAREALGRTPGELIVPHGREEDEQRWLEAARRDGVCSYESIRRCKDGSLVHVDVSVKAIARNGEATYFLTTQKDVTALKLLRDAKLLEARFRELLESMPDGIIMSNSTGHIVLANAQAERLFGYDAGELRGKLVESLLPARYRANHVGHRSNYVKQPHPRAMGAGLELYALRKDGNEFPVEISLSPLETEEGRMVMSAVRDITERKRFERTLHEKNIELENANQAKDRFLASMSHELRTPLNAIIGFTGTLLMRLPGPLTGDQDKQLRTIQTSARHLLSLINDVLDLAKIESGKVQLYVEPVVCQAVIRGLRDTFEPLAKDKGLQFRTEMPSEDVILTTDHRALSQILINLVNNAIKFTERGEILVSLSVQSGAKRLVFIRVTDTGVGIKPEEQAKLFQAFTQLDATSTRRYEGTGLGLYLCQKLADLIGATLSLRSRFGEGAEFTLTVEDAPDRGDRN